MRASRTDSRGPKPKPASRTASRRVRRNSTPSSSPITTRCSTGAWTGRRASARSATPDCRCDQIGLLVLSPASKKHEIVWLREHHPELLERALAIEAKRSAHLTTVVGLGRSFSWADFLADLDDTRLFNCCDGHLTHFFRGTSWTRTSCSSCSTSRRSRPRSVPQRVRPRRPISRRVEEPHGAGGRRVGAAPRP